MKKLALLLLLLVAQSAFGQMGLRPTGGVSFGLNLPATCAVGSLFFKTNATAGQNVYGCTAANTWTQQGGASGATITGTIGAGNILFGVDSTHIGLSTCNGILRANSSGTPTCDTLIGGVLAPLVSVLCSNVTTQGNITTGETDLITCSVPLNSLDANKKCVQLYASGTTVNNANVKTLKFYFGALVYTAPLLTASQISPWELEARVCRTGSNAQKWSVKFMQGGTTKQTDVNNGTAAQTDSGNITMKLTGQSSAATNDLVQLDGYVPGVNQ